MWSTVFATQMDRRDFVEMCLERSRPFTLDVTVNASEQGRNYPGCTCDRDMRGRLLPNEGSPCQWHFTFESLATLEHSKRIRALNIDFRPPKPPINMSSRRVESAWLALGSCRFFTFSFPQLTSLGWNDAQTEYTNHLFSNSPFTAAVRSLSFEGSWDGSFSQLKNLTSFTFVNREDVIDVEILRLFMLDNRSLESLSLCIAGFGGSSEGLPVDLLNLKSFSVVLCPNVLSTIIRVPALQRLSLLQTSHEEVAVSGALKLLATGDGITLSIITDQRSVAEVWQDLTGHARPTILHVRLCDYTADDWGDADGCGELLVGVHTLEVGRDYLLCWYNEFLDDLKRLGSQLKTIRFEVWEEMEPFEEWGSRDEMYGHDLLDKIEELVKYRFEIGRPFSVVERMVVYESERSNRQQDYVWRCFYSDRKLGQYVRPAV